MADAPLVIAVECSCGGYLRIEVASRAPDSIFDVDKYCRLATAWTDAHKPCNGRGRSGATGESEKGDG